LTLIAGDRLEDSLDDLRGMESVLIDTDPAKEAMVPRPDPSEELHEFTASILDEAEERLFSAYDDQRTPDTAAAVADGGRGDAPESGESTGRRGGE
jgi:flagellar protein FlaI